MSRMQAGTKPSAVSRALARDRLGVPAVLFFVLAGVAPLTVAAGVIPTAYATTGLTGIPAAFIVVAVILALFATGYVAMTRHITNSGAFYAFIARGIGRPAGVAAALVALVAYTFLQVGLYGAFGPNAAGRGRRAPGRARGLVGVGAGRLGGDHRAGPGPGRHHRQGPGRAAHRRDHRHPRRDRLRAGPPGGRAPELRHAVPVGADLGGVRHLRGAGGRGGARVRGVRAGPGAGRGGPAPAADHPGGHLPGAGRDRRGVRGRGLGHGRPRRPVPRGSGRGGARARAAVRAGRRRRCRRPRSGCS